MLSTLVVIFAVTGSGQESVSLQANVAAALRANADQLSGLHIRGYYQRRLLNNPKQTLEQLGTLESETEFSERVSFELWLDGVRLREQTRYPPSEYHRPDSVTERSFDSEKLYSGTAHPIGPGSKGVLVIDTPEIRIARRKGRPNYGTTFQLWYLHTSGFEGPQSSAELGEHLQSLVLDKISRGTLLSSAPTRLDGRQVFEVEARYPEPWMSTRTSDIETDPNLRFIGESGKLQKRVERERRTLVGADRIARFVLDPGMNYAVVQIQESRAESGDVMFETRNSDFVDLGNGLWLPRKCEVTSYAYGTRPALITKTPAYVMTIMIDKIERDKLEAKDFQIWFDVPGLKVSDSTHPKARPGRPFQYEVAGPMDSSSGGQPRIILIGANVAIAVGLLALLIWRRSRQRAATNVR